MIANVFLLLSSWRFGKSDFEDSQEAFLSDFDESFFSWFPDINDLLLCDVDDHVKSFDFSSDNFCDPESSVHQLFCSFDGHKRFSFSEEESKGS